MWTFGTRTRPRRLHLGLRASSRQGSALSCPRKSVANRTSHLMPASPDVGVTWEKTAISYGFRASILVIHIHQAAQGDTHELPLHLRHMSQIRLC